MKPYDAFKHIKKRKASRVALPADILFDCVQYLAHDDALSHHAAIVRFEENLQCESDMCEHASPQGHEL